MGAVLAKFFRKHKTTEEVLEKLDEEIHQIEKYSLNTQEQKKRFVGNFLAISIGIYVIAFIVFYFVYFPPTWGDRIIYSVPLFLFPLVIILLRKLLTWYFQRTLNKNSNKLTELRGEKKKLLEQVMDKETYKVAVNLLARFGDKSNGNKFSYAMTPRVAGGTRTSVNTALNQSARGVLSTSGSGNQLNTHGNLRQLNTSLTGTPRGISVLSQPGSGVGAGATADVSRQLALTPQARPGQALRRRTPFPIVNQQDKGVFERIVDVLIGDGPQDRFAMICRECFAHNGMALKEDFEYTTFRCAFCNAINPARKARPVAPRLPAQHAAAMAAITAKDSSDSSTSDDDTDKELELPYQVSAEEIMEITELSADTVPASTLNAATEEATATPEISTSESSLEEIGGDTEPAQPEGPDPQPEKENEPSAPHIGDETSTLNDEFKKEM